MHVERKATTLSHKKGFAVSQTAYMSKQNNIKPYLNTNKKGFAVSQTAYLSKEKQQQDMCHSNTNGMPCASTRCTSRHAHRIK